MRGVYFFLLVLEIALVLIAMFWLNEAVFFISGYDQALLTDYSVESFAAFREAAKLKLPYLILINLLSLCMLAWTARIGTFTPKNSFRFLMLINLALALSTAIFLFLFFSLPGRVL